MIKRIIKKLIFSFVLLYSFNLIAVKFNVMIPINLYTLLLTFLFDVPAMFLLIISLNMLK